MYHICGEIGYSTVVEGRCTPVNRLTMSVRELQLSLVTKTNLHGCPKRCLINNWCDLFYFHILCGLFYQMCIEIYVLYWNHSAQLTLAGEKTARSVACYCGCHLILLIKYILTTPLVYQIL